LNFTVSYESKKNDYLSAEHLTGLMFIIEKECVHWAVRTESFTKVPFIIIFRVLNGVRDIARSCREGTYCGCENTKGH
jgi:hypothetical protein